MPGTILNVLQVLSHYVHVTIAQGWFYYYSQFIDEKTDLGKLHNLKRIHHEKKRVGIWVGFELRSASVQSTFVWLCACSATWALCDPMDCSPPGSSVHGILQARMLEWVAMPSSRGPRDRAHIGLLSPLHRQVGSLPLAPPGKPFAWLALRNRSFPDGLHFTLM